jgi:hypothetical protein
LRQYGIIVCIYCELIIHSKRSHSQYSIISASACSFSLECFSSERRHRQDWTDEIGEQRTAGLCRVREAADPRLAPHGSSRYVVIGPSPCRQTQPQQPVQGSTEGHLLLLLQAVCQHTCLDLHLPPACPLEARVLLQEAVCALGHLRAGQAVICHFDHHQTQRSLLAWIRP